MYLVFMHLVIFTQRYFILFFVAIVLEAFINFYLATFDICVYEDYHLCVLILYHHILWYVYHVDHIRRITEVFREGSFV